MKYRRLFLILLFTSSSLFADDQDLSKPGLDLSRPKYVDQRDIDNQSKRVDGLRFKLSSTYVDGGECTELYQVLNTAEESEILACTLPNLEGSGLSLVDFDKASDEESKSLIVYLANKFKNANPKNLIDSELWEEYLEDREIGYKIIYAKNIDVNDDGKIDRVLKIEMPSYICRHYGANDMENLKFQVINEMRVEWQSQPRMKKVEDIKSFGFLSSYYLVDPVNGVHSLGSGVFLNFREKYFFYKGYTLNKKDTNLRRGADWASLKYIAPTTNKKLYPSKFSCSYSYLGYTKKYLDWKKNN